MKWLANLGDQLLALWHCQYVRDNFCSKCGEPRTCLQMRLINSRLRDRKRSD